MADLESIVSEVPDDLIPNFPQKLLFDTFVDACGPAMTLVSHMYFSANLQGTERDPIEQIAWLRVHSNGFSPLAKSIRIIRNKLAHNAILDGKVIKKFVEQLCLFEKKKTRAYQLVDVLVSRTIEIVREIVKSPEEIHLKEEALVPEEGKRILYKNTYEFAKLETLLPGHVYWLRAIRNDEELRKTLKGRYFTPLSGNFQGKRIFFQGWSGALAKVKFVDNPEIKCQSIKLDVAILLLG